MKYAMTVKNYVIGVIECDEPPIWGETVSNESVIAIEADGRTVEVGMVYDAETKTFSFPPEPEPQPTPTPSITMEELNQNQLTIMEALTDLYMTVTETGVE